MRQVVAHGRIKTVELANHITTGRQQWLQWHADFAENLPRLMQVPLRCATPPDLWAIPNVFGVPPD